jgi:general secretion pathway protein C
MLARTSLSASRLLSFLVWALVALCAVFWGLRLGAPRAVTGGPAPVVRLPEPIDPQALARLLGATDAAANTDARPAAGSRLMLLGVVAGPSGAGAALISVEGAPARPYRVGSAVPGALFLQSLQPRLARLGPQPEGPTTLTLALPALAPPVLPDRP